MGKVKKLNHNKEKKNPFDLRFNKVKHKVVNAKSNRRETGSNPYQSRNRANELRKSSLMVEYKNRNKIGSVKYANKLSKEDELKQKDDQDNHEVKHSNKRKENADYMSEMFEKKRLAQLERDKMQNLKDKLDAQWDKMKSSFLRKELARTKSNENKIDSYDLILNDLVVNPGQRFVPNTIQSSKEN